MVTSITSTRFFFAILICTISSTSSHPKTDEEQGKLIAQLLNNELPTNSTNGTIIAVNGNSSRLRQDEVEGATGTVAELGAVGENVGNIVTGLLGGNFGTIFQGVGGFIEDEDTALGVGNIFNSLSQPLTSIFQSGIAQGQKYFGYNVSTTANPLTIKATVTPVANRVPAPVAPAAPVLAPQTPVAPSAPIVEAPVQAPAAPEPPPPPPPPARATVSPDEDEDDPDAES